LAVKSLEKDNFNHKKLIMLFNEIIFGPVKSRRLGASLGVNLLPANGKICSFDCIYCECGFNFTDKNTKIPTRKQVTEQLEIKIKELAAKSETLDTITFAGNGEPTMHKDFAKIIYDVLEIRNKFYPNAKISVLSNAMFCGKKNVFDALNAVDNNILKLDSGIEETIRAINRPSGKFSLAKLVENLKKFNGNLTVQTLFFSGEFDGKKIDNTTENEIEAWLNLLKIIQPKAVMLYSLDRPTPARLLQKADLPTLQRIAALVEREKITALVNV
jgi:wyosine [tRNA(Phe)-imidazoG37] synthetase (radical SAM superfamily)